MVLEIRISKKRTDFWSNDILYFLMYSIFAQIWDDAKRTEYFHNYSAI